MSGKTLVKSWMADSFGVLMGIHTLLLNRGFHKWWIPKMDQNGWFIMENPIKKRMITGGTPISGHFQIDFH